MKDPVDLEQVIEKKIRNLLVRGEASQPSFRSRVEALGRRYGVSEVTLYRWRDEFIQGGEAAMVNGKGAANGSSRRVQELERALAERDRVIGELTIANRILKKTADGLY